MARELYNGPLDKSMDFTDPVGDGRPASGLAVQNYIKGIDGDKYGASFVDNENMCLFFSSTEDMETYQADPSRTDLIIGSVEMGGEPKYRMSVTVTDPENNYTAVFYGSKGNYIRYTFETIDRDNQRFLEAVNATYLIQNGGATTTVHESYHAGASVSFNVDKYLLEGNNDITVTLVGQVSNVTKVFGVRFQAIDISLTDNFDISTIYTSSDELTVSGTVTGSGTRYFEWYIDGVRQAVAPADTIISVGDAEFTRKLSLNGLASGRHNLQYRAYIEVTGGDRFYTNTMYRDFVINDDYLSGVTILTKFESPKEYGIIDAFTEPIPLHGPVQYEVFNVGYAIYSKTNHPSESLSITLGTKESVFSVHNGAEYNFEIREFTSGQTALVFECLETSLSYNATIESSEYNLQPITDTQFEFSGGDRSNDSDPEVRSTWDFGDYTGTLTGFEWTDASGWVDGRLVVPGGTRFDTDYAPYEEDAKRTGFTFEIEFSTTRVLDETVPIIDLRSNGRGLLITASEIIFSSRGGVTVNTKYKPDENVRATIVVTPTNSGTYPGFIFIYIDGVLTGAITYTSNDSFISNTILSVIGSNDAIVSIKQIRTYTRALTSDEILDNYILYRDTVAELVAAYDRNNIYTEGTKHVSDDKLAAYTPIIIITGDVNKLQNFGKENKKTYVKMEKIEVINMADPTKNMTLINPSMRCQGTSSMEYPRKNFRFYTQADSKDTTVDPYTTQMFDWRGNELTGKQRLYSFKDNAQPVKCWCLKADYAESSSTHNTGVARMWNDYMKNARIANDELDSRYYLKEIFEHTDTPCKTIAQHMADANNFGYDVRTTVNGFPITLFFHEHENEPLTFLGRYNWNNDKSTESVFGFTGIPGFEDYEDTMECWEVVNGDKVCNLFTDISHWDNGKGQTGGWYDSFESRYPDDHDEPSETQRATGPGSALKRVATWINSTMGASKVQDGRMVVDNQVLMDKFSDEKWEYLDVYKIAAYYVYLMRFGAVDQTVKNAMFTTEDGLHWYYINYDNDTINGVENSGALTLGYDIDRQSPVPGTPGSYCYAGHSSVLWNNIEADTEFMEIVRKVDNALFKAGLTYAGVIDMFNNQQSAKWSERTHNEDYAYKYLDIDDRTQLSKLQGPRKSHRQWWLSHRFAIYDAVFGTESYLNNRISVKPVTSTDDRTGQYVSVTPAVNNQIFGYGYQNPVLTGVHGVKDVPIQFPMSEDYYEGTTIKFYNAVYFKEIDFSKISKYVKEVDFTLANSAAFDTQLTSLIMGNMSSVPNTNMTKIENFGQLKYLENLEICNYTGFNKIDLTNNKYLKTLDFRNCTNLSSIELPTAAPITTIHYPYSINAIALKDLLSLNTVDIQLDGNQKQFVYDLRIENCPTLTNSPTFLLNWMDNRDTSIPDTDCSVYMDNVAWEDISMNDLLKIAQLAENAGFGDGERINFKGYAVLDGNIQSPEQAEYLMSVFGQDVFNKTSAFYIDAPAQVYLVGPTELLEGENATYHGIVIGDDGVGDKFYQIYAGKTVNENIDLNTGALTTVEPSTPAATHTLTLRFVYIKDNVPNFAYLDVQIIQRVYPSSSQVTLTGLNEIKVGIPNTYTVGFTTEGINGDMTTEWSVSGGLSSLVSVVPGSDGLSCLVLLGNEPSEAAVQGTLTATVKKAAWPAVTIATKTIDFGYQNNEVAVSRAINPWVMDVLVENNLINPALGDDENKMMKRSAMLITSDQFSSSFGSIFYNNSNFKSNCTNFDELQWFTGVTELCSRFFTSCSKLEHVILPNSIQIIGEYAFSGTKITEINLPEGLTTIGQSAFSNLSTLTSINIPSTITTIDSSAFYQCTNVPFGDLILPTGLTTIGPRAFKGCTGITSVTIPSTVTSIGGAFYDCTELISININCNIPESGFQKNNQGSLIYGCTKFESVTIGEGCQTIGQYAFRNQTWLTGVLDLPSSLTTIGIYAFNGCTEITSIIFRGTVAAVWGGHVFDGCTKLSTLEFYADVADNFVSKYSSYNNFNNCPITSVIIHEGCTAIGESAFYDQSTITFGALDFSHITSINIGTYAFYNCDGITSVTLGENITLGEVCFGGCDGITTVTIDDDIPNKFMGLYQSGSSVTNGAFVNCNNITAVNIGEHCTSIGNYAFQQKTNVEFNISEDAQITTIGYYAFYNCKKLTSIDLTYTTYIGPKAFEASGLTSVYLPATVSFASSGDGAFHNCMDLTSVSTSYIEENMFYDKQFYGCTNIQNISIIGNIESIPNLFCYNLASLESINIPASVTSIGNNAFSGCILLESINIPASVTSIGSNAFNGCVSLESINIPASVTSIGGNAFYRCTSLESITVDSENTTYTDGGGNNCIVVISTGQVIVGCKNTQLYEGVVSIAGNAFNNMVELESLYIPTTLDLGSGNSAGVKFQGCDLKTITVAPGHSLYTSGGTLGEKNCVVRLSDNVLILGGRDTEIWSGVVGIEGYAFYGRVSLTSITIPSSVTSIGHSAFYSCTGLTSIVIPPSVGTIGNSAFRGCTSLTSLTLPIGWTRDPSSIGQYIFQGCTSLTSITIPDYWPFGQYMFQDCNNLTTVTVEGDHHGTTINIRCFSGCALTSFTIPETITRIETEAFYNCNISSITISDQITSINHPQPWCGCPLTSITVESGNTVLSDLSGKNCVAVISTNDIIIGSSNTTFPTDPFAIGENTFRDNSAVTSITIPSSCAGIGRYAFFDCNNLETVNISCNIPDYSFYWYPSTGVCSTSGPFGNCPITNVTIGEGCQTIGQYALYNRTFMTSIDLPSTVTSIGNYAFDICSALGTITCRAAVPPTINTKTFPGTSIVQHIYVPAESVEAYQAASGWNTYATKIEAIPTP